MDSEPALTRSVLAGVLAGIAMLALDRLNRAVDFFNGDELTQARSLIPVVASVIAGVLIRRLVVPVAVHEAQVEDTALRGIALGRELAGNPAPPPPFATGGNVASPGAFVVPAGTILVKKAAKKRRPPVAAKKTTPRKRL